MERQNPSGDMLLDLESMDKGELQLPGYVKVEANSAVVFYQPQVEGNVAIVAVKPLNGDAVWLEMQCFPGTGHENIKGSRMPFTNDQVCKLGGWLLWKVPINQEGYWDDQARTVELYLGQDEVVRMSVGNDAR